jgi:hypothetical protein
MVDTWFRENPTAGLTWPASSGRPHLAGLTWPASSGRPHLAGLERPASPGRPSADVPLTSDASVTSGQAIEILARPSGQAIEILVRPIEIPLTGGDVYKCTPAEGGSFRRENAAAPGFELHLMAFSVRAPAWKPPKVRIGPLFAVRWHAP